MANKYCVIFLYTYFYLSIWILTCQHPSLMRSSQWAVPCQLHTLNYYAKLAKTARTPYGIRVSRAAAAAWAGSSDRFAVVMHAQIELWPIAKVSSVLSPKYANCDVLRACEKWQLFRESAANVHDNELCTERGRVVEGAERAANERGQLVIMLLRDITTSGNSLSRHTHTHRHTPMYTELEPREYRRPLSRHHSDGRTQRGCS